MRLRIRIVFIVMTNKVILVAWKRLVQKLGILLMIGVKMMQEYKKEYM